MFGFVQVAHGPEDASYVDVSCFEGLCEAIYACFQLFDGAVCEQFECADDGIVSVGFALEPGAEHICFPACLGLECYGLCAFDGSFLGVVSGDGDIEAQHGGEEEGTWCRDGGGGGPTQVRGAGTDCF